MEQQFCAKCGALLGRGEYNFLDGLEGTVCDACARDARREEGQADENPAV